jgi:hypothetical protein
LSSNIVQLKVNHSYLCLRTQGALDPNDLLDILKWAQRIFSLWTSWDQFLLPLKKVKEEKGKITKVEKKKKTVSGFL